jgi:dipeptidyl-peptidase-4
MSCLRRTALSLAILSILAPQVVAQKKTLALENLGAKGERVSFVGSAPAKWAEDGKHVEIKEAGAVVLLDPVTLQPAAGGGGKAESRPESGGGRRGERGPRGGKTEHEASPDGKLAAFVRKDPALKEAENLVVEDASGGNEWQVTQAKAGELFGHLDWVYQEEVYGRGNFKGFWWSPDSKWIAFLGLSEEGVKDFEVVDHVPAPLDKDKTVEVEITKYPKAGDPNPSVRLGIADVGAKAAKFVDLSGYDKDILIVRVAWDPDGKIVAQIQNRIQSWLDLVRIDPADGKISKLVREESKSWVDIIGQPEWLKDKSFLWLSDRSGYRHIYRHDGSGKLVRALTEGEWAVRDIAHIDEDGGFVYFTATKDGAVGDNLYRVPLAGPGSPTERGEGRGGGGEVKRLTEGRGAHSTQWNGDHTYFIDTVSSLASPAEQRLVKADGTVVKVLGKSTIAALDKWEYTQPSLEAVPARDGFSLDAMVIAPLRMAEGMRYPVWIETYSGPDAPSVRDAWNGSAWFQFLSQQGYFVFQVNVRTAAGKGLCTTSKCYRQFGVQELADLEDGVSWLLKKYPQADGARVGLHGWSFGGFMTAFALTHSKMFKLGVAGSGVYDWRLYDTIYTERYMDTPQANPEGYKNTSVVEAAKNLSGHLVLVHGTMDDNVHFQNTVRLAYELEKADKQFDVMIYPKMRHGPGPMQQWHLRQLIWRHMQLHLGGPVKQA